LYLSSISLLLFLSFFCSSPTPARNGEEEMLLLDLLSFRFAPVLVLRPELSAAFEEQFGKHLVGGFDFDDDDEEEDDEEDAKEESTWAAE
jgi:hypothetical protein